MNSLCPRILGKPCERTELVQAGISGVLPTAPRSLAIRGLDGSCPVSRWLAVHIHAGLA